MANYLVRTIKFACTYFICSNIPPEASVLSRWDERVKFRNEVVEIDRVLDLLEAKRGFALEGRVKDEPRGTKPAECRVEEIGAFRGRA